jgi:hypothetical protein
MTQHEKIIDMCLDGNYHCQNEFREKFIFSPHKRRNEIAGIKKESDEPTGKYYFKKIPCEHGVGGQFDYLMLPNLSYVSPPKKESLSSQQILDLAIK